MPLIAVSFPEGTHCRTALPVKSGGDKKGGNFLISMHIVGHSSAVRFSNNKKKNICNYYIFRHGVALHREVEAKQETQELLLNIPFILLLLLQLLLQLLVPAQTRTDLRPLTHRRVTGG